jgi:VWFA-related protein
MRSAVAAAFLLCVSNGVQDRPTFRVSTRLVPVTVVVQDKDGKPVTGLTVKDFQLYDGGVEQRIEAFAAHGDTGPAAAPAPAAANAPAPAGIHEFTNRLPTQGSATIILFDRLNTPAADQMYARSHLLKFLRQITKEDRVGIYVLDGGSIRVLHDFSNDARSLVRALSRYDAVTSAEVDAANAPAPEAPDTGDAALDARMAELLERAAANMREHFDGSRAVGTMNAFHSIASHLSAIEGRKSLIWVTSGFPLDALLVHGATRTLEIQRATRPLNDANITLYAVDARGLVGAMTVGPRGTPVFTTLSSVSLDLDILQIASAETGGRAFYNTNDINASVRRALDEAKVTYTLGYYPSHGRWDGTYRQIKVKIDRPGVTFRHRRGYFAGAAQAHADTLRATAVRAALQNPLEATGIALTARIERVAGTPADTKLFVRADPGSVTFERVGEEWKGTLDLVVAQRLANGTLQKDVDRTVELKLNQERYDEVRAKGFTIDTTLTLHPDVQRLHIVVHDAPTGSTGSIVVTTDRLNALMLTRH